MNSKHLSNITITLAVLTLLILPIVLAKDAELSNEEIKKLIDQKKWDKIAALSPEQKNKILKDPTNKKQVLEGITRDNLKKRASIEVNQGKGNFLDKLKASATRHTEISQIKFTGLHSDKIKFSTDSESNVIGNGQTWINLDDLPHGISEIEYNEQTGTDGEFTFKFKDDTALSIGVGGINKMGEVNLGKYNSVGRKGQQIKIDDIKLIQNGKEDKITLTKFGLLLENKAQIEFEDFTISRSQKLSGISEVQIISENTIISSGNDVTKKGVIQVDASIPIDKALAFPKTAIVNGEINTEEIESIKNIIQITGGEDNTNLKLKGKGSIKILKPINEIDLTEANFAIRNGVNLDTIGGNRDELIIISKNGKIIAQKYTRYSAENPKPIKRIFTKEAEVKVVKLEGGAVVVSALGKERIETNTPVRAPVRRRFNAFPIGTEPTPNPVSGFLPDVAKTSIIIDKPDATKYLKDGQPVPDFQISTEVTTSFANIGKVLNGQRDTSFEFRDKNERAIISSAKSELLRSVMGSLLTEVETPKGSYVTNYWSSNPYVGVKKSVSGKETKYYLKNANFKKHGTSYEEILNLYKKSMVTGAYGLSKAKYKGLMGNWCKSMGIQTKICGPN
jgi:hypothetical protein